MFEQLAILVTGFFATGASMIAISHHRQAAGTLQRCDDWLKYAVYALLIVTMLITAGVSRLLLALLLLAIAVVGSVELKRTLRTRVAHPALVALPFGILVKLSLGHLLLFRSAAWFTEFAFVFILVSVCDSFAQLWGRLLGRHKLCPRLSPGKTFEGLVGGVGTTVVASLVLARLLTGFTTTQAVALGLTIATAATAGDLLFSMIKRKLRIKDFSGLLPGHGGVFDRFDSLIVAAPVSYWIGRLIGI